MEKKKNVANEASKDENIKKVSKSKKVDAKSNSSSKATSVKDTNKKIKTAGKAESWKKVEVVKTGNNKKAEKIKFQTSEQEEFKSLLIVILVVIICVAGIYLITRAFVTKDLFQDDSTTEDEVTAGTIDYEVAIMGQILNRPYDEYYVVIYDKEAGDYINDMYTLTYSYGQLDDHLHMYVVDLSNEMNKQYYDPDNVNTDAKSLSEIKVGDITLLKIKNGVISKYIVDYAKMESELGLD